MQHAAESGTASTHPRAASTASDAAYRAEFRRGVLAMAPLWPGGLAFGISFAVVARAAGFGPFDVQALSMLVYAGSAELAIVTLFAGGASVLSMVLTALVLNLRHILYGLSLEPRLPRRTRPARPVLALFLTDESYGVTIHDELSGRQSRRTDAFFFGASIALYVEFALANLIGVLAGSLLPDPSRTGIDFVFPLTFLALLLPLVRSWRPALVAALAAVIALALSRVASGGVTILVTTLIAAAVGASLEGPRAAGRGPREDTLTNPRSPRPGRP